MFFCAAGDVHGVRGVEVIGRFAVVGCGVADDLAVGFED